MKLRDLFDISMADFYEIHNGEDFVYKIDKHMINTFIQDYRATIEADVNYIMPIIRQQENDVFKFSTGLYVIIN